MADSKPATKVAETNEAQIAVHWKEEEYFQPSKEFVAQANLKDPAVTERFAEKNFPKCFEEYADMLTWYERWHTVLDTSDPPFWKWFVGGKINASFNCVDRHLARYRNKAAIIFVPEPEDEEPVALTYQELYIRVNEFAALLLGLAASRPAIASRSTCRWSPSCRSRCSPARGWASSIPSCSAASPARRAACAPPIPAAAFSSTWTATTAAAS